MIDKNIFINIRRANMLLSWTINIWKEGKPSLTACKNLRVLIITNLELDLAVT